MACLSFVESADPRGGGERIDKQMARDRKCAYCELLLLHVVMCTRLLRSLGRRRRCWRQVHFGSMIDRHVRPINDVVANH